MSEKQSSYRQMFKATSIFGGVEVFKIIIGIIRSKLIAILLGPTGMGISGLLTSTTGMVSSLTNFGLGTSAVKDVSVAYSDRDSTRISFVVTVVRKLVWITGLLGAVIILFGAPFLSQLTFGNNEYTWAFVWLSITLLLNQISTGQNVVLRGTRQIKYLAKSSAIGSLLGLVTTIPLYYFFGLEGIVPGIIISSITALLLSWHYARKINIPSVEITGKQVFTEGRDMLKMGFLINLNVLITSATSYIVRLYISSNGSIEQVGLYNAGFAIINSYVSLVFTAMATDYYPRLSAIAHDNTKSRIVINQQAEIALLIISPILMVFIVFINWIVVLLYSTKFTPINNMILFAAIGMFFKAASWSISYIFVARGASKLYFWNELTANIYLFIFNILGYKFGGLTGMGVSFMIGYILYLIQVYLISNIKYGFNFGTSFNKIFFSQLLLAILCLIAVKSLPNPYTYFVGFLFIIASSLISFNGLKEKLGKLDLLNRFKNKKQ